MSRFDQRDWADASNKERRLMHEIDDADERAVAAEGRVLRVEQECAILRQQIGMSGWISVKDRLPSEDGKVLVHVPTADEDKPYVGVAWYDPSRGWSLLPTAWIRSIENWMPVPSAPEERG